MIKQLLEIISRQPEWDANKEQNHLVFMQPVVFKQSLKRLCCELQLGWYINVGVLGAAT